MHTCMHTCTHIGGPGEDNIFSSRIIGKGKGEGGGGGGGGRGEAWGRD